MKTHKTILTLIVLLWTASNALGQPPPLDPVVGKWKGRYTDNKGRSGRIRRVRVNPNGTMSGQLQQKFYEGGRLIAAAWIPFEGTWSFSSPTYSIDFLGTKKVQSHRTETSVTATANLVTNNRLRGPYNSTVRVKAGGRWYSRSGGGKLVLNRCKPGRPKNVRATDGTSYEYCYITWNPVFGATEYRVWRARRPDGKKKALGTWYPDLYYKDAPTPRRKFYYWVKARNSAGRSPFSKYDRGWRVFPPLATASLAEAAQNTTNEHLYALGISSGLDYPVTEDGIFNHQFFLEAETDATVQLIDVITPAGANFTITDEPNTQSGPVQTWHYQDQNNHYWQYQVRADEASVLADYTDGLYIITVTYQTGGQSTTTLEFADPNTGDPIPQPTEQPVLTAPEDNATVASPVT
ncbi:MAG: fibronectin type III domain-containing protein, partial [Planctomycetota bacterium]